MQQKFRFPIIQIHNLDFALDYSVYLQPEPYPWDEIYVFKDSAVHAAIQVWYFRYFIFCSYK